MRDRIERQTAKRTQMLAMISHDLKTPLRTIISFSELIERELNPENDEKLLKSANINKVTFKKFNLVPTSLQNCSKI